MRYHLPPLQVDFNFFPALRTSQDKNLHSVMNHKPYIKLLTSSNHRLQSAGMNALEELLCKMLGIEKMVAYERRHISGCQLSSAEAVTAGNMSAFTG